MKRTCTPGPDPPKKRRRKLPVKSENKSNSISGESSLNTDKRITHVVNNTEKSAIDCPLYPYDEAVLVKSQLDRKDEKGKQTSSPSLKPRVKTEDNQSSQRRAIRRSQPSLRELFRTLCPNELKPPVEAKEGVLSEPIENQPKRN